METRYLALGQLYKQTILEDDGDIGLGLRLSFVYFSLFLEVDRPCNCLFLVIGNLKLEDPLGL